jgi:alcohol dehydrogenase YqhD (iron-dependent ADH family)
MENFIYSNQTKVIFGKDAHLQCANEAKGYGKNVLVHFGGKSAVDSGLIKTVNKLLTDEGFKVFELGGVQPNPVLSLVNDGIGFVKKNKIDLIIAVGGGSVIDSAKAIAAGAKYQGDVWDFFIGKASVVDSLPLGVILTIAAAGSETSSGSVITNDSTKQKYSFGSISARPKFALLNPELTTTVPAYHTAAGIVDMFSHVYERYFTKVKNVDVTNELCEGAMRSIFRNGARVMNNLSSYDIRSELMLAGMYAHSDILQLGRTSDWGTHRLEHELSALYDISHGAGLAIMIPAWMEYVYLDNLEIFFRYAKQVWRIYTNNRTKEEVSLEGIMKTKEFFQSIGMPTSFNEANIDSSNINVLAKNAMALGSFGSMLKMTEADAVAIYKLAAR